MFSAYLVTLLPYLVSFSIVYHLLKNYWQLRNIPGPIAASFSDIWRLWQVYQRKPQEVHLKLHEKYGDVVRLGPNCVSVSGPDTIPMIYGIGKGFVKSDFYYTFQNVVNGHRVASLVAETDETVHAKSKRNVAHAFSLSTMVEYEPLVDSTTTTLLSRLDELFAGTGNVCDFGKWLQFYAFDVIGELTFSKRLGFLESGTDVGNIMRSISANFDWFSVVGQMPSLDLWLGKNPIYQRFFAKPVTSPIVKFSQKLLIERIDSEEPLQKSTKLEDANELPLHNKPDFLSRFLALRKDSPEPWSDGQTIGYLFANINAGSDTIASTLRAVFYYLLKNPTSLSTLLAELDQARESNKLTVPLPTWSETQKLPYLAATIKEALRLHPALSLPLERVVPASGLQLDIQSKNDKQHFPTDDTPSSASSSSSTHVFLPRHHRRHQPVRSAPRHTHLRRGRRGLEPRSVAFRRGNRLQAHGAQSVDVRRRETGLSGSEHRDPGTVQGGPGVVGQVSDGIGDEGNGNGNGDGKGKEGGTGEWRLRNAWLLSQDGVDVRLGYR